VRRLIGWTAGIVGLAALARTLARHRRRPAPASAAAPAVDDRAEALRRKLDETRAVDEAPEAAVAEGPTETLEERRARVHAKAHEAIEAMQEPLA
jgi:hypothetical protein